MRSAYEWGVAHHSCQAALALRASCRGSQRRWWRECPRGDWLLWQLMHGLTAAEYNMIQPAIARALDGIVERSIRFELTLDLPPAPREWAERWLSGVDRSAKSAWDAQLTLTASCTGSVQSALALARWTTWAAWAADSVGAASSFVGSSAAHAAWAIWAEEVADSAISVVTVITPWSFREIKAEQHRQARDIRREIPRWLWDV